MKKARIKRSEQHHRVVPFIGPNMSPKKFYGSHVVHDLTSYPKEVGLASFCRLKSP